MSREAQAMSEQIEADLLLDTEVQDLAQYPLSRAITMLRALGLPASDIQSEFGIIPEAQNLLIMKYHKDLYHRFEVDTFDDEKEAIEKMATASLRLKYRLLHDETQPAKLRNDVATEILDRVMGKARQTIEQVNYNVNAEAESKKIEKAILDTLRGIGLSDSDAQKLLEEDIINV